MVFAARLTQRGHEIRGMDDLIALYEKSFSENTVRSIGSLPHPTVQKFAVITVAIVGASRRFLSQITRHQNEVKYMSASLQYSDYSGCAEFAVPYEIIHFAPNVDERNIALFDRAFSTLEMFGKNGAVAETLVRAFGKRWEQPLFAILNSEPERKPSVTEQLKQKPVQSDRPKQNSKSKNKEAEI